MQVVLIIWWSIPTCPNLDMLSILFISRGKVRFQQCCRSWDWPFWWSRLRINHIFTCLVSGSDKENFYFKTGQDHNLKLPIDSFLFELFGTVHGFYYSSALSHFICIQRKLMMTVCKEMSAYSSVIKFDFWNHKGLICKATSKRKHTVVSKYWKILAS